MPRLTAFWRCAVLALVFAPTVAVAGNHSVMFVVSVQVLSKCRIATQDVTLRRDPSMNSGYRNLAYGAIAMDCSRNTGYTINLGSQHAPSDAANRNARNRGKVRWTASDPLQRNEHAVFGVSNGSTRLIPIYGWIPTLHNKLWLKSKVRPITVTITY